MLLSHLNDIFEIHFYSSLCNANPLNIYGKIFLHEISRIFPNVKFLTENNKYLWIMRSSDEEPRISSCNKPIGTPFSNKNPSDAVLVQLFAFYFSHFILYMILIVLIIFVIF